MRMLYAILSTILISTSVLAQMPEKMSYQAVIRNTCNQLVINHVVGMQITILQGSVTGNPVYTETQTPATNINGLVSIEIGGGDDFSSIDWAIGPYFVKTETDTSGGTNYSISETRQLLVLPYVFYAKNGITPEEKNKLSVITGTNTGDQDLSEFITITELNNSLASKVDTVNGKDLSTEDYTTAKKIKLSSLINIDGSETKVTAGTNMTITGKGTLDDPYVVIASKSGNSHYIGEFFGGGIVFYIDQTGQHGLICSLIDLSTNQVWSNVKSTEIGSAAKSNWNGLANSNAIVTQSGHTNSAAKLCLDYINTDYGTGIYSDWYLPSMGELNDLWNSYKEIQKALSNDSNITTTALAKESYWSSTEVDSWDARYFYFSYGYAYSKGKGGSTDYHVRAVRAF
jgi:hypothetical protein